MKKVIVYGSTGGRSKYSRIMHNFYRGVKLFRDDFRVIFDPSFIYKESDLAVIFGSCRQEKDEKEYHMFKKEILKFHNGRVIFVESCLLGRIAHPAKNSHWRVGVDHFMLHEGKFGWRDDCPSDRFEELGLKVKPWNDGGDYVLLGLQILNDASLLGLDYYEWTNNILEEILEKTDKNIRIRLHPLTDEKRWPKHMDVRRFFNEDRITISQGNTLEEDLANAHCMVTYSSGSGIDAILAGVPHIAMHPGSMVYPISGHSIEDINDPPKPDRTNVLNNLAYSQWTPGEMQEGLTWEHLINNVFSKEDE